MFKKLTENARLPERATKYSAGFDVYSNEDVVIRAGETKLIGLGIAFDDIDMFVLDCDYHGKLSTMNTTYDDLCANEMIEFFKETHYFALHIRSSLRAKGLTSLGTGIIDMDYRDEIKMVIHSPIKSTKHYETDTDGEIYLDGIFADLSNEYKINRGDKIGQLILCRHEGWLLPSEYTKDEERTGGFGSTGV